MPANLFFGTGIAACIIVLDKEAAASRQGIFMIDASKDYIKDGNKNRLREQDIRKIVDVFNGRLEIPKYSRFVPNREIKHKQNSYSLNIPRYIDTQEPGDIQDIEAHLKGGIPGADIKALSDYWQICPTLKKKLFKRSLRKGYSEPSIPANEIKKTILSFPEFKAFRATVLSAFTAWRKKTDSILNNISSKDHPKLLIQDIAEKLLATCASLQLIDKYDIYQHLMTYWSEVMQDDVYIIFSDGWPAGNEVIRLQRDNKGKKKDIAGLVGLEGRLIPLPLLINTYFTIEQKQINNLKSGLEQIAAEMNELKDEHSGEEGLLTEVILNDKVTKGNLQKRIREIRGDADQADELKVLEQYMALFEKEAKTKQAIKEVEQDLECKVIAKYPQLSLKEIKTLVVERKWITALKTAVEGEVDRLSQMLTGRVKGLIERYQQTLPELVGDVDKFAAKVDDHLKKMGFNI